MEPELLYTIYVVYYNNNQQVFKSRKLAYDFINEQELKPGEQISIIRFMITEEDYFNLP